MISLNEKIHKGRMAVYSECHQLHEDRIYYSSSGMKRIMEAWMADYPAGYYIMIRPYNDDVKKTIRLQILHGESEKEKMVRPPAVYNNIKPE